MSQQSNTLVLKGATVFGGTGKLNQRNYLLIVKDGIISYIGPEVGANIPADGKVVDLTDKFIIPGLIDSHIHFFQSAGLFTRPDGLDLRHIKSYEQETADIKKAIPEVFKRYLACGITGVVDCGGPMYNFEVVNLSKEMLAPHVAVAGPLASTVSREKLDIGDAPIVKVTTEEEIDTIVKKCHEKNPVFMKIWFIFQKEQFDEDSKRVKIIVEKAKSFGMKVAVHATELETARRAVQYGADILVHSVFTDPIDQAFVDLLKEKGVIYIPTLMVRKGYRDVFRSRLQLSDFEQEWGDPAVMKTFGKLLRLPLDEIPETHRNLVNLGDYQLPDLETIPLKNLKAIADAGIVISAGTDAGNVGTLHGPALHYELELMVKAGMKPAEVLLTATKNAAKVLGKSNTGTLEVGKIADLVILEKDPTEDIKNTRTIEQVMRNGVLYKPAELVKPTYVTDIVDKSFEAYNNRDVEALLALCHPKIQIIDFHSKETLMQGIEEVRSRYNQLFARSPAIHVTVESQLIQSSLVITQVIIKGVLGEVTISETDMFEVKNHLITRVWVAH